MTHDERKEKIELVEYQRDLWQCDADDHKKRGCVAHYENEQAIADALTAAANALRSGVPVWLDTTEIKPETDHETVIVTDGNGNVYTAPGWIVKEFPRTHPHWMRIPSPPKVPGLDERKCQDKGETEQ